MRLDLINSSFRVSIRIASGNLVVDMLLVFTRNQNEFFRSRPSGHFYSPQSCPDFCTLSNHCHEYIFIFTYFT